MKRMPFERPTDHYDERILGIDEQLCALLKQRKETSNHNPGFPPLELISKWAADFGFYEDFLRTVFGALRQEEHFRPIVEPSGFRAYIPVMKSIEQGGFLYSVTTMKQYNNASVITLNVDWDIADEPSDYPHKRSSYFDLYIGEEYDCRMSNGASTTGHSSQNYVVSPPLPDNIGRLELIFKEYERPFKMKPTGAEIVIRVD